MGQPSCTTKCGAAQSRLRSDGRADVRRTLRMDRWLAPQPYVSDERRLLRKKVALRAILNKLLAMFDAIARHGSPWSPAASGFRRQEGRQALEIRSPIKETHCR